MAGIFPRMTDGGVVPASATNAFTPLNVATNATYFPADCTANLTSEVLNSLISEVAQVVDAAGNIYDGSRTDNLLRALDAGKQFIKLSDTPNAYTSAAGLVVRVNTTEDAVEFDRLDASEITYTPTGNIAATTVFTAINELDGEKLGLAGGTVTGPLRLPVGSLASPALQFGSTRNGMFLGTGDVMSIVSDGTAVATFDPNGGAIDGDLTVTGDLTVQGAVTTVSSTDLFVSDNIITLNDGETGAGVSLGTAGIEIDRGTDPSASFLFNETSDLFTASHGVEAPSLIVGATGVPTKGRAEVHGSVSVDFTNYETLLQCGIGGSTGGPDSFDVGLWVEHHVAADGFIAMSDKRKKRDIQKISAEDAIDFVSKMQGYGYVMDAGRRRFGFISQEAVEYGFSQMVTPIQDDLPRLVDESGQVSPEGFALMFDYLQAIPLINEALKAVLGRIDYLERR